MCRTHGCSGTSLAARRRTRQGGPRRWQRSERRCQPHVRTPPPAPRTIHRWHPTAPWTTASTNERRRIAGWLGSALISLYTCQDCQPGRAAHLAREDGSSHLGAHVLELVDVSDIQAFERCTHGCLNARFLDELAVPGITWWGAGAVSRARLAHPVRGSSERRVRAMAHSRCRRHCETVRDSHAVWCQLPVHFTQGSVLAADQPHVGHAELVEPQHQRLPPGFLRCTWQGKARK